MAGQLITDETDYVEQLPESLPITFLTNLSNNVVMLYSNCKFYRTAFNTNIALNMPIGNNIIPTQWFSQDVLLPSGTFNSTKPITEISFPNNNSVQINYAMKFYHHIEIYYKLSKNLAQDGYQNMRKIQVLLVRADGVTVYDNIISYRQPGPNNRDVLQLSGEIDQNAGDILKLRFNVIQDNQHADQSDTYLTIYSVTWNLSGLKVISN
jgi:hypothetical protein